MKSLLFHTRIFAAIVDIDLDSSFSYKYNEYVIVSSPDQSVVEFLGKPGIQENYGKILLNAYNHLPFIFLDCGELSESNFVKTILKHSGRIEAILCSLWLVKDNSVGADVTLGIGSVVEAHNTFMVHRRNFYKSEGTRAPIRFSSEELDSARSLGATLMEISLIPPSGFPESIVDLAEYPLIELGPELRTVMPNPMDDQLDKLNRIGRAYLVFLTLARQAHILPVKILNYMSILECLFVDSQDNINKQICNRVSVYLESDPALQKLVRKNLINAYDIRSRYVHGDNIPARYGDLKQISHSIDEIVRRVFLKISSNPEDHLDRKKRDVLLNSLFSLTT